MHVIEHETATTGASECIQDPAENHLPASLPELSQSGHQPRKAEKETIIPTGERRSCLHRVLADGEVDLLLLLLQRSRLLLALNHIVQIDNHVSATLRKLTGGRKNHARK